MMYRRLAVILLLPLFLNACAWSNKQGTLAELEGVDLELKDAKVEDGLEKAMASYKQFLKETPESAMTPEAIRRIADLSIEKEYGIVAGGEGGGDAGAGKSAAEKSAQNALAKPESSAPVASGGAAQAAGESTSALIAKSSDESDKEFEQRVAQGEKVKGDDSKDFAAPVPEGQNDLRNANAEQAIRLYKKLLKKYPLYERNDQVLYQMSRAYEELGQVDKAMEVMNQFVKTYPTSKYMDEVQFRRAEYYFTRKKFLDSEDAYKSIVAQGPSSSYYELALYKLGWSYYKQELYEEALNKYIALLDHKVSIGYDFEQEHDKGQRKRMEDTFRVISLSFSNLGGPLTVKDYFSRHGERSYEDQVYSHLGEFYLTKRRYNDAAESYKTFVGLYPYNRVSPHFNMRVIEIYNKGGFGRLVVEAKKEFAETYALDSEYWHYFELSERPDVVAFLKSNLKDLANHYHAMYQDKRFKKDKQKNYAEALLWYRNYLSSFPKEKESPGINYQMAELMMENKDFGQAAIAFENTAYNYPLHEKSAEAGYAAVYAHREHLKVVPQGQRGLVKQQIIKSSLKFADTYPKHEKVTLVLGAAADDLYEMKNYQLARKTAHKLLDNYPQAEKELRRSAWLVVGHSSFEMTEYAAAEQGYIKVLALTPKDDKSRAKLYDNLAASIYKQGEEANKLEKYKLAAEHFLRVGKLAPNSKIRPKAEYDAAAALINLKNWDRAASVLVAFRANYPHHELQHEATKKIAYVYREAGKLELAAAEYERIERESKDEEVRRGSLLIAAELYHETGSKRKELAVYKRYVGYFPKPVETSIDIYDKMASVYKALGESSNYMSTLKKIVSIDSSAGEARTDRTRYLAAQASLELAEPLYERFAAVALVNPLKQNIVKKKKYMKEAVKAYSKLTQYEVADVTAAATYYIAEIYYNFSRALKNSERPANLTDLQREQYELALEDQIFPFEEKAITVHKKNIELLHAGYYSGWIDKSIAKLAKLYPAAYARSEIDSNVIATIDSFRYVVEKPAKDQPAPAKAVTTTSNAETETAQEQASPSGDDTVQETTTTEVAPAEAPDSAAASAEKAETEVSPQSTIPEQGADASPGAPAEDAGSNGDPAENGADNTEAPVAEPVQQEQSAEGSSGTATESPDSADATVEGEPVKENTAADSSETQDTADMSSGSEGAKGSGE